MSWLSKLTSEETRALLRSGAKLVLELVGPATPDEPSSPEHDAARVAVAAAGVASHVVSAARDASKRSRGGVAIAFAIGAALGAGALYVASPAGRAKARALAHRIQNIQGWRA